ncbi:MAG: 16S rRNA (cytosine(1402)-N(4))-methyltransferase RsmH [Isosphaeraceae bacterium]
MADAESIRDAVHRPVLIDEVLDALALFEGAIVIDGTVGAGGHAKAIAEKIGPSGKVVGFDRDPKMLALADEVVKNMPVTLVQRAYSEAGDVLKEMGIDQANGILLDLGLSSDQLAWADRGFSFAREGPLDMRFDPEGELSAADIVNHWDEQEIADLIYQYGEDRNSRRIARRIVEERKKERIETTGRLAEIVRKSSPGKWGAIDPSTRTFQALRIAANRELEHLDSILKDLPVLLKNGGRAAIISFQSLEDRRVKWAFRNEPRLTVISKKPITASAEEIRANPRARSAKLRVAERCPTTT